jgi:hypothetical protein
MISILLSIATFLASLPVKSFILAKKVQKASEKRKNNPIKKKLDKVGKKSEKEKREKKKISIGKNKDGKDNVSDKAAKALDRLLKALSILLHFLRACAVVLSILATIIMLSSMFLVFLVAGACGAAVYLLLLNGDYVSTITNSMSTSSDGTSTVASSNIDTSNAVAVCEALGKWYIANVPTYQSKTSGKGSGTRTFYACDLLYSIKNGATVGDDCTGFAAAYASLVAGTWIPVSWSGAMYSGDSNFINAGWKYYKISEIGGVSGLLPGDILVCNNGVDSKSLGHHAEVYLGPSSSFGWGKIQSQYPSSSAAFTDSTTYSGYIDQGSSHRYGVIYRYEGN